MIGLSAQDTNIQHIFAQAQATMEWPWPCTLLRMFLRRTR